MLAHLTHYVNSNQLTSLDIFDRRAKHGGMGRLRLWIAAVGLLVGGGALGQGLRSGTPLAVPTKKPEPPAAPDSPRAALGRFLALARSGRYAEASSFLDVPADADGPLLARRLTLALERNVVLDLARVSPLSGGDAADGFEDLDELGQWQVEHGTAPVRLERVVGGAVAWRFDAQTVATADAAFEALPHAALLERLPAALLRAGPADVLWYQWLLLPLFFAAAWALGSVLARLVRAVLRRLAARTQVQWDDAVLARLGGPITLACTFGVGLVATPALLLAARAEASLTTWLRTGVLVAFFWALSRAVEVVVAQLLASPWSSARPNSRALLPLSGRITRVAIAVVGAVAVVSSFGYPVASILAGLGIGGLAVALAAQKTFENLFGAFAVGLDQPFREGDFVKVDDFVGTIETVGLRSTRIRTLDRTIITLPNGQLAEKRIESYAARDRIRFAAKLGLEYGTTSIQVRVVLEKAAALLKAHPKAWPQDVQTRFVGLGPSSLDLEVVGYVSVTDFDEFSAVRTELLLGLMAIVEEAGARFAFPTSTVHVASLPAAAPPP